MIKFDKLSAVNDSAILMIVSQLEVQLNYSQGKLLIILNGFHTMHQNIELLL